MGENKLLHTAFGHQYVKGWVGIVVFVVMRVQDQRWGLRDEIALGWEYRGMEQLVEPKQDIIEGMRLVIDGLRACYKRSWEKTKACLILLHMLCLL